MPTSSVADLVAALRSAPILEAAQREELLGPFPEGFACPRALADELRRRGWLSAFQADKLLQGKGPELVLGPYVLVEWVGAGGMGEVFKARHPLLKRTVAVKVLRQERLAAAGTVHRFLREIEAAGQLSHPNIVMAHDAAQVGDTFLLVMEFVEGKDLAQWVQEAGPLPVARACDFIRQAALGLQHAHERGLVHRDVKPSNLLVTARDGVVKVADLGLARLRQPDAAAALHGTWTHEGALMGTPHYLAPEQARDARRADARADVYSLGCTFYHLLTGRPPFAGQSLAELILRHAGDEAEPVERLRPEVPAEVGAVVRRMMAKRPEERHQTAAEVARALAGRAAAPGRPDEPPAPAARPSPSQPLATTLDFPPARGRLTRGRARNRLLAAACAALVGLTALALVWRLSGGRQAGPGVGGPTGEKPVAAPVGRAGPRLLRPTSFGGLAPITVVPYRYRPACRPGQPSRNVRLYQESADDDSIRVTALEGGALGHVPEGATKRLGALVTGSTGLRVVVNPALGYTTVAGLRFKDAATLAVLEEGKVEADRPGVRAVGPDGALYVSRDPSALGQEPTILMLEVYHWLPPLRAPGASRNIEVFEGNNGNFTVRPLGPGGEVASVELPGGGRRVMPDALGSTNIKVVVNRELGYTTVAGLRFTTDTTLNIDQGGTVAPDRPGVIATEPFNKEVYVSKEIDTTPKRIAMVLADLFPERGGAKHE